LGLCGATILAGWLQHKYVASTHLVTPPLTFKGFLTSLSLANSDLGPEGAAAQHCVICMICIVLFVLVAEAGGQGIV
jgi:hypothetical protein